MMARRRDRHVHYIGIIIPQLDIRGRTGFKKKERCVELAERSI